MRLLVLGGTMFLSRAVAVEAVRRGHDVVCACRGESGKLPDGARLVRWDRAADPAPVEEIGEVDVVVDVARRPSWVRAAVAALPRGAPAVAALPDAHWVFVSTVSVYTDNATPSGRPGVTPLLDPIHTDVDLATDPEAYGAMKVGCELAVTEGTASSVLVRPGLIVGPEDPTSRYGYWPERLAEGGEVLAGGTPDDVVQVIDVRDLAAWLVTLAEQRTTGTLDAVGPTMPAADLLARTAEGVGSDATLTWVPDDFLAAQGVEPWAGEQGLPLWLPRPEYDGMLAHDPDPPVAAGLTTRPVPETAADTLDWLRSRPDAVRTGLSREREREVLAAWHART